jgi:hypothetical protein
MKFYVITSLFFVLMIFGCKPTEKSIHVDKLNLAGEEIKPLAPGISLQYLHPKQLLVKSKNKKQFMIAVRITNNRDSAVFLRQSQFHIFTANGRVLPIVNPSVTLKVAKENGQVFLYHILKDFGISYLKLSIDSRKEGPWLTHSTTSPSIGTALVDGTINLVGSKRGYKRYKIPYVPLAFSKPIKAQETIICLLPIESGSDEELFFRYVDN